MALLKLNDWGTRQVLSQFELTPERRIGRGYFCAVYEAGPASVLKLTVDGVQLESVRDHLVGPHFPRLTDNLGCVGTQAKGDFDLFLFKSERLRPIQAADAATRRLAREVIRTVDGCLRSPQATAQYNKAYGSVALRKTLQSQAALEQLVTCPTLPGSVRTAFEDLYRMVGNYVHLVLDFHSANLMVRGTDELVFNDVIADGDKLY